MILGATSTLISNLPLPHPFPLSIPFPIMRILTPLATTAFRAQRVRVPPLCMVRGAR